MMTQTNQPGINPQTSTVGEIVAKNYHAAGVLKKYGIDFCCGGGKTLQAACEKKKLDAGEVLNELQNIRWGQSSSNENFNAWEPDYLIEHIIHEHHRFVRLKTEEIQAYAERVAQVHGKNHPETIEVFKLFSELSNEMLSHLNAEEERVFPLIREISECRSIGKPLNPEWIEMLEEELALMEEDHDGAGGIMKQIRELTGNFTPPADACTKFRILYQNLEGFEEDLHKHVHLENNILFKKAEKLAGLN